MCGIFGVVNDSNKKAAITTLEGLKKLEYRGYDSWGISLIPNNESVIEIEKHIGKIGEATTTLPDGNIALGHTRWATHGGVTDKNAHPHLDCSKKIAVIHNGIVENYQELKESLLNNHHFSSETDTEVIAHLLEDERKNKKSLDAVITVFKKLIGSNAICVLDLESKTITASRNGSPLVLGKGTGSYYLASDVTALLKHTRDVYFLLDGETAEISQEGIKLYETDSGKELHKDFEHIDWKEEDAEKSGYPHFLLKEIMEQKNTIPKTASVNTDEIKRLGEKIQQGYKISMIACGSASYTTIAARYFFAAAGIDTESYGAYEFLPFARLCDKKTMVIAVSQSGETADTLIAIKEAKKNGAYIVAVVNARNSSLERLADSVLAVSAGPEIAVVSTKGFTSQLATLYLLSKAASGKYDEGDKHIKNLGTVLDQWLNKETSEKVISLAKELIDHKDIYIIGKYLNYPAALEFALKLKESSYTHAEAFASGELKHGVIALIQKGTPCIVISQNDDVKPEVLSSAMELKARGGMIIGVAPFTSKEFDHHIQTPELNELTLFGNIIVGQLLGYYMGIGKGADPDKPRNLAKSVTVK